MMKIKCISVCLFVMFIYSQYSCAEIYRYQDENGKWRYTDKTPPDQVKSEVIKVKDNEQASGAGEATGEDLAEYLKQKINPGSAIEKATLAVVKIETSYGTGSGFFINENGYLITNKHVVRPSSFAEFEDELKQAEAALKQDQAFLSAKQHELDSYKKQIDDYQEQVNAAPESAQARMREELNDHNDSYHNIYKEYQKAVKQVNASKQTLADRKNGMSESSVASRFKIIFKDGTTKEARLIELGKDQDLALLKITGGYKTPFLEKGLRQSIMQGGEVFAIGSPLGFTDFVTKGIVTRQEVDRIVTDTEILPGNSGGPLITPQGQVIGVNTAVYSANGTVGSEVFGFAIPIEIVTKEFAARLQAPKANDKGDLVHKIP